MNVYKVYAKGQTHRHPSLLVVDSLDDVKALWDKLYSGIEIGKVEWIECSDVINMWAQ